MRAVILVGVLLLTPNLWAEPLSFSLDAIKRGPDRDYKARAEKLLADINNRLAIERNQELMGCKAGKIPEACGH
jgi:hypothetical protein